MLPKMWKMNAREYYISRQAAAIDPRVKGGGHKREREVGSLPGNYLNPPGHGTVKDGVSNQSSPSFNVAVAWEGEREEFRGSPAHRCCVSNNEVRFE
jgi:hypothetical protein